MGPLVAAVARHIHRDFEGSCAGGHREVSLFLTPGGKSGSRSIKHTPWLLPGQVGYPPEGYLPSTAPMVQLELPRDPKVSSIVLHRT